MRSPHAWFQTLVRISSFVLLVPIALYAALTLLSLVVGLWLIPSLTWEILAIFLLGVLQIPPRRTSRSAGPVPPVAPPPMTPSQQARYDDMRATGWSDLASRQAVARR